jgi:hypothetical protein
MEFRMSLTRSPKDNPKAGYTFLTLPHIVTPYRNSVNETHTSVTYQKLVTRLRYGLFRCAVGIWPSHQRADTVTAWAYVDVQRCTSTSAQAVTVSALWCDGQIPTAHRKSP